MLRLGVRLLINLSYYAMAYPNLLPILAALFFFGTSCSSENSDSVEISDSVQSAPVSAASKDLVDDASEEPPFWPDVEFFVRRHASGGSVGAFGRYKFQNPGTSTFEHSSQLGEDGNEYGAKWCWLGRAEGGDRYAVEVTISGSELPTIPKKELEVVYRGERLVVHRDEEYVIGAGPRGEEQKRDR